MQQLWNSKPLLCDELVGREPEVRTLQEALDRAANGRPQMILLAGEAGVGKTKLCRVFTGTCQEKQALYLLGQAMQQDQGLPFGPFLDMLRRYFSMLPSSSNPADPSKRALLAQTLQLFPELATAFAGVLAADVAATDRQPSQRIFHRALAGLQELVRGLQKPLVLVLEDLHWADETSLDLLGFLAQRLEVNASDSPYFMPVLIVGTYRLEALAEGAALRRLLLQLRSRRLLNELHLSPLTFSEHWQCVNSILKQEVSEQFARYLFSWDEGNPFFTEELLGAMVASGQLQKRAKGWIIPADMRPQLPSSLTEAILERLRRLPEVDQEVLAYASVLGRVFDYPLLAALCQVDEQSLVKILGQAMQAQLISEMNATLPDEPGRYQFRHALTREVIYDQMLIPERHLRHRVVAETLERLSGDVTLQVVPRSDVTRLLAEHYWHAGLAEKACPHALQEAERARRVSAFHEERSYLDMAQSSLPQESPERLPLLQRMGMLSMCTYKLPQALKWLDMAKAGYQQRGEQHKVLYVLANLMLANWQIGSPALRGIVSEVEELAEQALSELDKVGGDVELLAAMALFAHYWVVHALPSRSLPWVERCFALFEQLNDPARIPAIQLSHITRGWYKTHQFRQDFEEGIAEVRRAIDISIACSLPDVIMIGHTVLAWMQICFGRGDEAERVLQEASDHEERSGTLLPSFVMGWHYFFLGKDWEKTIAVLRAHSERLDHLQVAYLAATTRVVLAHFLIEQGELEGARQLLEAARPILGLHNEYLYLAMLWWGVAKMHVLQGNPAGARQEYECLLSAWKATEDTMTIFPTLLDGTLFYAEIGDLLNSRRWLAELEDVMQVTDNPVGLAALQEGHGVIRAAQGDLEGAISALRLAVEAWKRLQLRLQWARTSQRLARLLLEWARRPSVTRLQTQAAREEAAQLLAQAESVYRDLDISPGVEAVRALRCGKRLEAQEKRRQTMLARSDTSGLTRREMEVLSQLGLGKANKEIAAILHISIGTVEQHISHIFDHLGCDTRAQAIIIAMERGLLKEKVSLNGN